MAKVIEDRFGVTRCETCEAEILCNEFGDMPDVCPVCKESLDWSDLDSVCEQLISSADDIGDA